MMLSKIPLLASLLFFLFGTNALAYSHQEEFTSKHDSVLAESFDYMPPITVVTASNNAATEAPKTKTETAVFLSEKDKTIEPSVMYYVVPVSVGLLLIIGLGSYWLIYKRKHV
jgi:hypothetical protein